MLGSYFPYRLYIRRKGGTWEPENYNTRGFDMNSGDTLFFAHQNSAPDLIYFRIDIVNGTVKPRFSISTLNVSGTYLAQVSTSTYLRVYDSYNNTSLRTGDADSSFDFSTNRPILFSPEQCIRGEAVKLTALEDDVPTSEDGRFTLEDYEDVPLHWTKMEIPDEGGVTCTVRSTLFSPLCAYTTTAEVFGALQLTGRLLGVREARDNMMARELDIEDFTPLTRPTAQTVRMYINDAQSAVNYFTSRAWKPMFNQLIFKDSLKDTFHIPGKPIREIIKATEKLDDTTFQNVDFGKVYSLDKDSGQINILESDIPGNARRPGRGQSRALDPLQISYIYGHDSTNKGFPNVKRYVRSYAAKNVLTSIMNTQFGTENLGILQYQVNTLSTYINEAYESLRPDRVQMA